MIQSPRRQRQPPWQQGRSSISQSESRDDACRSFKARSSTSPRPHGGHGFSPQLPLLMAVGKRVSRLTIAVRIVIITNTLARKVIRRAGGCMVQFLRRLCTDERGQDIAEYAVMLAVILVLVIGTVRLIGGNANSAFSSVASSLGTQ